MKTGHLQYDTFSLKELAEHLHINYYQIISAMIAQAEIILHEVMQYDLHRNTEKYTDTCNDVLQHIAYYLNERKKRLVPYLKELHDKDANGHDCSMCKDGCAIGHNSYLILLQESHIKLMRMLYELQAAALPLYTNLTYPALYRTLRTELLLIDIILRELFHIEEMEMMPKMVHSQKKINVRAH